MASINNPLFPFSSKSTGNKIGERGAKTMSDALKSNTTLTQLDLLCKHKRNNTQMTSINESLFILIKSTGNNIGDTGTTSLSDALKTNTTLTKLNLRSEDKRNNTNVIHKQSTLFISHKFNSQQDWRFRCNIIE